VQGAGLPRKIRTTIVNPDLLDERRERIARDAIKIIVKQGYARTTTREIAEACGMSEGAMYRYVGSKADILHLIGRTITTKIDQPFEEFADGLGNISRTEALRTCWRHYLLAVDREQDLLIIWNRETLFFNPADRRELTEKDPPALRVFERLLREGIQSGEFVCDNPEQLAFDIWILSHQWALKRWLLRRSFSLEQYTKWHEESFLALLGVGATLSKLTKRSGI